MRPETRIAMAVTNVGDGADGVFSWEGTFQECVLEFAKWCGPRTMKRRIDVIVARSQEEARSGLVVKRNQRGMKEGRSELEDRLFAVMNQAIDAGISGNNDPHKSEKE